MRALFWNTISFYSRKVADNFFLPPNFLLRLKLKKSIVYSWERGIQCNLKSWNVIAVSWGLCHLSFNVQLLFSAFRIQSYSVKHCAQHRPHVHILPADQIRKCFISFFDYFRAKLFDLSKSPGVYLITDPERL